MEKSPEAFRTISEVADFLDTPAHVLRFWESRFPQIRPVKRAGGRRYYRPADVALLSGIKRLLHDEGMTIRGVQKILREQGIRYVASLSSVAEGAVAAEEDVEAVLAAEFGPAAEPEEAEPVVAQTAQIISLERALARGDAAAPQPEAEPWPADSGDAPPAPSDHWPHDPEDVAEAPFAEVEGDESENEVVDLHPAPEEAAAPESVPEEEADEPVDTASSAALAEAEAGDETPPESNTAPTVSALLRRLPPAAATRRKDELRALHQRLFDLRERLAQAARRRAR